MLKSDKHATDVKSSSSFVSTRRRNNCAKPSELQLPGQAGTTATQPLPPSLQAPHPPPQLDDALSQAYRRLQSPINLHQIQTRTMGGFDFSNHNRNAALHAQGVPLPKATSTGTTIVGCLFDGGVVIAADTRATSGPIVADKACCTSNPRRARWRSW